VGDFVVVRRSERDEQCPAGEEVGLLEVAEAEERGGKPSDREGGQGFVQRVRRADANGLFVVFAGGPKWPRASSASPSEAVA